MIMERPSILQGMSLTRLLQGIAIGTVATMAIGFWGAGWTRATTAEQMAMQRSEVAVVAALAPGCAEKFSVLPDADARRIALSNAGSYSQHRDRFPRELVTLPGESYPDVALVAACSELVLEPKSALLN